MNCPTRVQAARARPSAPRSARRTISPPVRSPSCPSASPSSKCCFGVKAVIAFGSKFMMLDIAVLVGAIRHFVERQIGNFDKRFLQSLVGRFRGGIERRHLVFSSATSAISASAMSLRPAFLAPPISFDAALLRACACSEAVMAARRASSRSISRCASPAKSGLRRVRRRSNSAGLSRIHLMSCMGGLRFVAVLYTFWATPSPFETRRLTARLEGWAGHYDRTNAPPALLLETRARLCPCFPIPERGMERREAPGRLRDAL